MAITYPLTMPATPAFRASRFGVVALTAVNASPLTGAQQALGRVGDMWEATFTLPPMTRAEAAAWTAFFAALRGQYGTFYGYDPDARIPRGVATGTPLVKGGGQYGTSVVTDGWTPSMTGVLRAGDYLSFSGQLFMCLADVNSNASGEATIDLYPAIRVVTTDNAPVTVTNPVGVFRLSGNQQGWDTDDMHNYSISFSAIEAVTG